MASPVKTCPITIRVQAQPFDVAAEMALLTKGQGNLGALTSFVGLCRDEGGTLAALEIEHYHGMAEAEIARVAEQAITRWPLQGLTIIHRFGRIVPGEQIVLVLTAGAHRAESLQAADFLMDYLKTSAPFWKRQILVSGEASGWVEAKTSDEAAAARWQG